MPASRPTRSPAGPVRPPAMTDVAAAAGVSHQTVSRVLNDKGSVREETRQRVLDAIDALGYRRNEAARTLASNRSRLIGVLTPRLVEWGPATTLLSVQLAANREGYFVSVATLAEFTATTIKRAVDDLLSLGVVGLIAIAPVEDMAVELEAQSIPVPTLVVASRWIKDDSTFTRVGVDQRAGVRQALLHLKARGCRSVGHIAGPAADFDAEERDSAWRQYCAELGMKLGPHVRGGWTAEKGYLAAKQLLSKPLPDALFVANDQMALGALRAFSEAGVNVPEDMRLFGFDDQEGVAFFEPGLTTLRQDFAGVGVEAISMLNDLIAGREVASRLLPAELKIRASA